jgi:hypothetical protein
MDKWAELLLGLILVIGAIIVAWYSSLWWGEFWNFRNAAWLFLKGGAFWLIAMIGVLFILLGISDLKG